MRLSKSKSFRKYPEVLKSVVSHRKFRLQDYRIQLVGLFILTLLITLMFPRGKSFQFADLKEGRVYVGPEIIAPFTFPVNKSADEYEVDRRRARQSVPPVFVFSDSVAEHQLDAMIKLIGQVDRLLRSPETQVEDLQRLMRDAGVVISSEDVQLVLLGFPETNERFPASINPGIVQRRILEFETIAKAALAVTREIFKAGVLSVDKSQFSAGTDKLSISRSGQDHIEELEEMNYYQSIVDSRNTLLELLRKDTDLQEREVKIAYQIAVNFLQPNVLYDQVEHQRRIEDAVATVPLAKDQILAGERIIDSHQRITRQHIEKLNSFAVAKAERGEVSSFWKRAVPAVGKFLFTLFILSILVIYLYRARRPIVLDLKRLLLIALIILLVSLFTFIVTRFDLSAYLIPVAMAAIIITIFFDADVGLVTAVALSLLTGAMRGNEYSITFISLFASTIVILTVSKVRTRNWVLHSMGATIAAYLLAITVHDFVSYISFSDMAKNWLFGMINGFFAPIFAYGMVIIFEFAFDLTTDMTLLELSDLNQPLLRQLAMRAPGTYHHSIVVGNLAEAATEAIGGNPLLARVGSYYHDIGKMEKPEYFVENQTKGHNPQEKLTPSMSSLILLNHVRKGADMAHSQGLPREIEDFIYEHHGTGLMGYFYQKALEQSDGENISANEFRYPGPRPRKKETAIVMLADAVEATSRTLKDPTPSRIKNVVENLIDERFKSGELDDSPLTLQDLSKISEAFQKILNGIFHSRIDYPAGNGESGEKKEKSV
ncbi:HDIG domain-containing protein [candidate division KSB1 bacterium]|nr:HDIG domain-containing protein [candidate division KSB1 bacterium]